MGDVKLTPRQTADLLTRLDEGLKNVAEARDRIIDAMAERRAVKPRTDPDSVASRRKKVAR